MKINNELKIQCPQCDNLDLEKMEVRLWTNLKTGKVDEFDTFTEEDNIFCTVCQHNNKAKNWSFTYKNQGGVNG